MSEHQPPSGAPEYLEHSGGAPLQQAEPPAPTDPAGPGGRRRRVWWMAGGVLALAGLGAGAWAALGFFQQGAQPAEVLPAKTIAYLSIDLDPSGGQKIDAFRTLNEFPAFKNGVGVNTVDELKRKIGDQLVAQSDCGLSYENDIQPWLGDRAAVAAVDLGQDDPDPVFVVQVTNEDKARAGFAALKRCDSSGDETGYVVHDGWAVVAQTQNVADETVAAARNGTLADDPTYQKWTKAVGDAGVVNAYAAPAAGDYLVRKIDSLGSWFTPYGESSSASGYPQGYSSTYQSSALHSDDPSSALKRMLADFNGMSATIRFTGHGVELATAGDFGSSSGVGLTGDQAGALASRLPDDTAAAMAISLKPGWIRQYLDQMSQAMGGESTDQLLQQLSDETGLDVPGDLETLLGSATAVSIGKDFDFEAASNSSDGTGLPVAAIVNGDPAAIEKVLDKLRARVGDQPALGSDSSGDLVAVGPTAAYRQHVLTGGHLGDTDAFRGVIPSPDSASLVLFVNIDALESSITQLAAGDTQVTDNIRPLQAIGASAWRDGSVSHFSLKVGTD